MSWEEQGKERTAGDQRVGPVCFQSRKTQQPQNCCQVSAILWEINAICLSSQQRSVEKCSLWCVHDYWVTRLQLRLNFKLYISIFKKQRKFIISKIIEFWNSDLNLLLINKEKNQNSYVLSSKIIILVLCLSVILSCSSWNMYNYFTKEQPLHAKMEL